MGALCSNEFPELANKIFRRCHDVEKSLAMMTDRVTLLNGKFDPLTLSQTTDAIFKDLAERKRGWLCTVNVAILMMMRGDARLQQFVDRASIIVADGQPLVWIAPWLDKPLPERVTGVDLVESICARAVVEKKSIYLLGATSSIVEILANRLRIKFPGLQVDYADGYFSSNDAVTRADKVRQSGASILLVGMGVPRQEFFIEKQWERLGVGMAIGVGGSFDVLAGLRRRAPIWVQSLGLEWTYRMLQEPRRLFKRYLVTNLQFIRCLFAEFVRLKGD
jgi:N-acetylglucosaminyldiphosphoundecaprenol N-acetyl-beta-D-mannosaminyltransferase